MTVDHWNDLVKIIKNETAKNTFWAVNPYTKKDVSISEFASILLSSYNTASGSVIMKKPIEQFVKSVIQIIKFK
jgi:hypothetical protein